MYICTQFMEYILHIDTSTDISTVAISSKGTVLTHIVNEEVRNHAASINNMIAAAVQNISIALADLSAVAVCAGPGSYTGLRIAMATAKGICYAFDLPLIINDRLSLIAYNTFKQENDSVQHIAVILTAREKEYFIGIYNNEYVCEIPPVHISEDQLPELLMGRKNLYIIADAISDIFYKLEVNFLAISHDIKIDVKSWSKHAHLQYECKNFSDLLTAVPLYLKQVYTHK